VHLLFKGLASSTTAAGLLLFVRQPLCFFSLALLCPLFFSLYPAVAAYWTNPGSPSAAGASERQMTRRKALPCASKKSIFIIKLFNNRNLFFFATSNQQGLFEQL
jgi:hypothetical protein